MATMAYLGSTFIGIANSNIARDSRVKWRRTVPLDGRTIILSASGELVELPYKEYAYGKAINDAEPGEDVQVESYHF